MRPPLDPLTPVDPRRVRVGGEIGRRIDITLRRNLLAVDADVDFLRPFLEGSPRRYIGLGKLIDAAVHFALYSGDREVVALKEHLVRETIRAQHADGYIGTLPPADRMRREYDIHEMAYLVLGLTAGFRHYGNRAALEAATKLADYLIRHWPEREPSLTTLGLEAGFMALSKASGDPQYLGFCASTPMGRLGNMTLREWRYPTQGHVYRYLARAGAQLDLYRAEPDDGLLVQTQQALDFLTAGNAMVITGACSHREGWHSTQAGEGHLGETCATAYLIRLLDNALRLTGDVRCGDLMERTVYNALFAAQSPEGRDLRYFTPFEGRRRYFRDQALLDLPSYDTYCCPNNYRRIVAELPRMVYYQTGEGLVVNLFVTSEAQFELASGAALAVRQETDYPNTGRVVVHIAPAAPTLCTIGLRIPRWCGRAMVLVSGESTPREVQGGQCHPIHREWWAGDRIEVDLPMPWRLVERRAAQEGRVAVMRGPMVYCLSPQRNECLQGLNLKGITLDGESLQGPVADAGVRPDGLACGARAWSPHRDLNQPSDLELLLTEFSDPTGEATYFCAPPSAATVPDELASAFRLGVARGSRDSPSVT